MVYRSSTKIEREKKCRPVPTRRKKRPRRQKPRLLRQTQRGPKSKTWMALHRQNFHRRLRLKWAATPHPPHRRSEFRRSSSQTTRCGRIAAWLLPCTPTEPGATLGGALVALARVALVSAMVAVGAVVGVVLAVRMQGIMSGLGMSGFPFTRSKWEDTKKWTAPTPT